MPPKVYDEVSEPVCHIGIKVKQPWKSRSFDKYILKKKMKRLEQAMQEFKKKSK